LLLYLIYLFVHSSHIYPDETNKLQCKLCKLIVFIYITVGQFGLILAHVILLRYFIIWKTDIFLFYRYPERIGTMFNFQTLLLYTKIFKGKNLTQCFIANLCACFVLTLEFKKENCYSPRKDSMESWISQKLVYKSFFQYWKVILPTISCNQKPYQFWLKCGTSIYLQKASSLPISYSK
jgi:hypothetical protein